MFIDKIVENEVIVPVEKIVEYDVIKEVRVPIKKVVERPVFVTKDEIESFGVQKNVRRRSARRSIVRKEGDPMLRR